MNTAWPLHRAIIGKAAAAVTALPLLACHAADVHGDSHAGSVDLGLIEDAVDRIQRSYVEPVNDDRLTTNALKGMLAGLDPHSDYMDEQEYQEMLSDTRGEFGGIGIQLTLQNGVPTVISPIDGTPAAAAGIDPGDRIVKIDDQPTNRMTLEDIVHRLRGPADSTVTVQIARANRRLLNVTLTRTIIHVVSVKSRLEKDKIGYIRVTVFSRTTPSEFAGAIARLSQQAGGHLNGLVLDLRNDPGGLLDSAVDVADDLLDGGTVVTIHGRENDDEHVYDAPAGGDRIEGAPMVVLINGASASAAEIVAGALQDHRRATVMGTRSFGKGSVQSIIPLSGGRGALRLTTARYYTPSGHSIQDGGIDPDVVVTLPKQEQVPNAIVVHEADLPGALRNTGSLNVKRTTAPAAPTSASETDGADANEAPIDPSLIGTAKDRQLDAALKYLQGSASRKAALSHG